MCVLILFLGCRYFVLGQSIATHWPFPAHHRAVPFFLPQSSAAPEKCDLSEKLRQQARGGRRRVSGRRRSISGSRRWAGRRGERSLPKAREVSAVRQYQIDVRGYTSVVRQEANETSLLGIAI